MIFPSEPRNFPSQVVIKSFSMDEQALIRDAQAGDLDAFNTLILHYQDSVYNTALRILGDEDHAADATQEAFISAFKSISSFRGGSFKAWLMRTVTNACYDELRRQKRRPTTPLEPDTDDGEEMDSPRWLDRATNHARKGTELRLIIPAASASWAASRSSRSGSSRR